MKSINFLYCKRSNISAILFGLLTLGGFLSYFSRDIEHIQIIGYVISFLSLLGIFFIRPLEPKLGIIISGVFWQSIFFIPIF
jgi:hypothetical protein